MENNSNNQLMLGVILLVIGLFVAIYSISSYSEIKSLGEKINFEDIDANIQLSTSDKYYKYLSNADFLNQKLNKNKDILIKNASCVYLDYAQHNAIELYNLTYKKMERDEARQSVAAGNVRALYNMLDNYKTCSKSAGYKTELQNLLDDIQNSNLTPSDADMRMEKFLNGYDKTIQQQGLPAPETEQELEPVTQETPQEQAEF